MPQALLCYRVFEHMIEANYRDIHACRVELLPGDGLLLRLALDCPDLRGGMPPELRADLGAQGLELQAAREDETWYLTVGPAGKKETAGPVGKIEAETAEPGAAIRSAGKRVTEA